MLSSFSQCPFVYFLHLSIVVFNLYPYSFTHSTICCTISTTVHHLHFLSAPSSLFFPASIHLSIHASPHLSSLKTASPVQWGGLSSAPLQRPLWLSPPHVLSPQVLTIQPPVPIRGLSGGENPWSEAYWHCSMNTQTSKDFKTSSDFGKKGVQFLCLGL